MQHYKKHLECAKKAINSKCNWMILFLSVVIFYMLVAPYDSIGGFDMLTTFFGHVVLISTGVFLVSTLKIDKQKDELLNLNRCSLASLVLAIVALLAEKSLVIPEIISIPLVFIAIVNFLFMLKKAYNTKIIK